MENDATYQYLKLLLDYVPVWSIILVSAIVWAAKNPGWLQAIPTYVSSARIGEFEIQLRQLNEQLSETENHVAELEEENLRLNQLYAKFDAHAPLSELEKTRQEIKVVATNLDDISPALEGLAPGAEHEDVYAAAEILRTKRDFSSFDALIDAIDRIASDDELEELRFHTVWTLASAVHKTVLAAVKHSEMPRLSKVQLSRAKDAMQKLYNNPHVQLDRPDAPKQGIRGPSGHALNWIEKGLDKFEKTEK